MSSDPAQGTTRAAVTAATVSLPGAGARPWVLPAAQQHRGVWRAPCGHVASGRSAVSVGAPSCWWGGQGRAASGTWRRTGRGELSSVRGAGRARGLLPLLQTLCRRNEPTPRHAQTPRTHIPAAPAGQGCAAAPQPSLPWCPWAPGLCPCQLLQPPPANVCAGTGGGDSTAQTLLCCHDRATSALPPCSYGPVSSCGYPTRQDASQPASAAAAAAPQSESGRAALPHPETLSLPTTKCFGGADLSLAG